MKHCFYQVLSKLEEFNLYLFFRILAAMKNGTYKKACCRCIINNPNRRERISLLKPLMNDPNFLEAKSFVWQEVQVSLPG